MVEAGPFVLTSLVQCTVNVTGNFRQFLFLQMEKLLAQLDQLKGWKLCSKKSVQALWNNYGEISRIEVENDCVRKSLIVKFINPFETKNTTSHLRKVNSYEVEARFYEKYAKNLSVKVPDYFGTIKLEHQRLIVLEDLSPRFPGLKRNQTKISTNEKTHLIKWLAGFHGTFLGCEISDLSSRGTYWHLETRREELAVMKNLKLKKVAEKIDQKLRALKYQTLVHGDAKLPNFCFGADSVAAVDFQYVGPGCGLADLWYLFCDSGYDFDQVLVEYFNELRLTTKIEDLESLESEWREALPFIVADFERFLNGWCPGTHFRSSEYSQKMIDTAISLLN